MIQTCLFITVWSAERLKNRIMRIHCLLLTKETQRAMDSNRRSRQREQYLTAASILTGRPYLNFITILLYNTRKRIKCIRIKDKYRKVGKRMVGLFLPFISCAFSSVNLSFSKACLSEGEIFSCRKQKGSSGLPRQLKTAVFSHLSLRGCNINVGFGWVNC